MKTSGSIESKTRPGEGGVGVNGSRAKREESKLDGNEFYGNEFNGVEFGGGEVKDKEVGKKVQKCKNLSKSKKAVGLDFLTLGAKLVFTELRQVFVKAPILHHFDLECYIHIKTDTSGYAIGGVLSQLTLNNLGQWHLVAFFSWKMIPAETRYETHNGELLAMVEAFKIWRHYLKGSQHEVLVLTDHNNFQRFLDMKSLSSKQVRWA